MHLYIREEKEDTPPYTPKQCLVTVCAFQIVTDTATFSIDLVPANFWPSKQFSEYPITAQPSRGTNDPFIHSELGCWQSVMLLKG